MAARKSSKPSSKPAPTELLAAVHRNGDAVTKANLLAVPTVTAGEIEAGNSAREQLCLNIMAGRVSPEILEAHAVRGRLAKLFPKMGNAERNALRVCLDSAPSVLVTSWAAYLADHKKVNVVTLQALAKAVKPPKDDGEKKISLRDALTAWCAENEKLLNDKKFPHSLVDIFIKFELIGDEEEEEEAE